MYRQRLISKLLKNEFKSSPVLVLLGARQVGKSTLAKNLFMDFKCFDLENPRDQDLIQKDPELIFDQFNRIIVDEAQRMPTLFSFLRYYIDKHPKKKIVLLGSSSLDLIRGVSETLTGRAGFVEISNIMISEFEKNSELLWIKGSYPSLHWKSPKYKPGNWYRDLLLALTERDVPQLGFKISSQKLRGVMTLIAQSQGSLLNLSEIGGNLGLNHHEVNKIIDIFEGIFIIRRLRPYYNNAAKRLVKSPKIYIRDTGMMHFILDIPFSKKDLLLHPKAGASFESFCIEQIISAVKATFPAAEFFFYRTQAGAECDLIIKQGQKITPIEIKMTTQKPHLKSLKIIMKDLKLRKGYVISLVKETMEVEMGILNLSLESLIQLIMSKKM